MRGPHDRHSTLPLLFALLLVLPFLKSSATATTTTTTVLRPLQQHVAAWCLPSRQLLQSAPGLHILSFSAFGRTMPAPTSRRPSVAVNVRKGEKGREDSVPPAEGTAKMPKDRKKRRVALVLGYVGTNYSGLQKSETGPDEADVMTIESVLEKALFDSGYIRESNYGDLEKIGWARCSRTDKGVHAARNVVSAKLELWQDDMGGDRPYWSERAVKEINAFLPDDIRVHSCAKVTKSFRPRDAVSFREYEYIVPLELLRPFEGTGREVEGEDDDALIARFINLLVRYQGTHNFHNFTKIKSRDLVKRLKAKAGGSRGWIHQHNRNEGEGEMEGGGGRKAMEEVVEEKAEEWHGSKAKPGGGDRQEEGGEEGEEEDDWTAPNTGGLSTAKVDGIRRFNTNVVLNPLFQILRASPQNQRARNDPDRRKTREERGKEGGDEGQEARDARQKVKDDLKVDHVPIGDPADGVTTALWDLTRYQGVLKMVRTNIYRCEGRPLEVDGKKFVAVTFHGSSFLYNQIRLLVGGAIGVATGLFPETALEMALESPYLLYSPLAPAEGLFLRHITFGRKSKNPVVMMERDLPTKEEMQAANCPNVYALLSHEAVVRAEEFERKRILTQINHAWTKELQEGWRRYARCFKIEKEVQAALEEKYGQWRESIEKLEEAKAARELFRRQSMVTWMEREGREGRKEGREEEVVGQGEVGTLEKEIFRSYRKWMPQRFATDLIIKFRLKPGKQVGNVQRGLAVGIAEGRVPTAATTEELFALMEEQGGVAAWEEAGKKVRGPGGIGWGEGDEEEEEEEM